MKTRGQWPYWLASNYHLIDLRKLNNRLRWSNHTLLLKSCCGLLMTSMTSEITYDLGLEVLDLGKVLSHVSLASKCHFSQNVPTPLLHLLLKPCQDEPLTCWASLASNNEEFSLANTQHCHFLKIWRNTRAIAFWFIIRANFTIRRYSMGNRKSENSGWKTAIEEAITLGTENDKRGGNACKQLEGNWNRWPRLENKKNRD